MIQTPHIKSYASFILGQYYTFHEWSVFLIHVLSSSQTALFLHIDHFKVEYYMLVFSTADLFDEHSEDVQVMHYGVNHFGKTKHFKGQAVIVRCPQDNSFVSNLLRLPGENRVLVVDALGSLDFAFLGDKLATLAIEHNWAGVIINGCVRDVEILKTLPLGILAIGHVPRKTKKLGEGDVLQNVTFFGATVSTSDWIYADENGVLISKIDITASV